MKGSSLKVALLMGAVLASAACAPAAPSPTAAPPKATVAQPKPAAVKAEGPTAAPKVAVQQPAAKEKPAGKAAWEEEWDRVLEAAKREGVVALAGYPTAEARQAQTEPFEQKYGIKVELEGFIGSALVEKLRLERESGQYRWDLHITGTTTFITNLKPLGVLEPIEPALILPEVKDPANWRRGLEFFDKDRLGLAMTPYVSSVFMFNPSVLDESQFTSYRDLLDPRLKGRIVTHDPRIPGPGNAIMTFLYAHQSLGTDFIRALINHDLAILRDERQELDGMAQGRYDICLGCSSGISASLRERGVPIKLLPPERVKEGSYITPGPGAVAWFNQPAHPNAAKVYLNWLLGKEGQTRIAQALLLPSARRDVSNDWVEPWQYQLEGHFDNYSEEVIVGIKPGADRFLRELLGS